LNEVTTETVKVLSLVQIGGQQDVDEYENQAHQPDKLEANHPAAAGIADAMNNASEQSHEAGESAESEGTFRREEPKVGRNDPCPCGSGKKYKQCCGKLS